MHNLQADRTGYEFMLHRARWSAWRWECQGIYCDQAPARERVPDGVDVARVWVLTDPLTESQHRQLDALPERMACGERIGVVSEARAVELDLPDHDFWIVDDEYVIVVNYRDHLCVGATAVVDPAVVAQYRQLRDLAARHAVASTPSQRAD